MLLSPFCDLWYYYGDLYYYYYMVSIIWQENKRETLIGLSSSKAQSLHVRRRKKQGVLGLNWTLLLCNYTILLPYSSTRNQVCIYLSTLTNLVEVLENMAASPHALYIYMLHSSQSQFLCLMKSFSENGFKIVYIE